MRVIGLLDDITVDDDGFTLLINVHLTDPQLRDMASDLGNEYEFASEVEIDANIQPRFWLPTILGQVRQDVEAWTGASLTEEAVTVPGWSDSKLVEPSNFIVPLNPASNPRGAPTPRGNDTFVLLPAVTSPAIQLTNTTYSQVVFRLNQTKAGNNGFRWRLFYRPNPNGQALGTWPPANAAQNQLSAAGTGIKAVTLTLPPGIKQDGDVEFVLAVAKNKAFKPGPNMNPGRFGRVWLEFI